MNRFTLIITEWNCYNGFIFQLIHLDLYKPTNIDSALIGINFSKQFLYINIFFKQIKIYDKSK